MKASVPDPGLTFHSPDDSGFPFVLFWCVTGSLLAHVATFFLFHIVYPQRVSIHNPAPYVSLLLPDSPENIALLRWIEAEDPALVAMDNSVPPPGLAEVRYRPSFATPQTAPLGAPVENAQAVRFPPAVDRLITGSKSLVGGSMPAVKAARSTWRFGGTLAARPLNQQPAIEFAHQAADEVGPTTLLVGVNATGEVRYTFLQQPSGDAELDQLAATHLHRIHFAPAEAEITWAHAVFDWGSDAYAEKTSQPE